MAGLIQANVSRSHVDRLLALGVPARQQMLVCLEQEGSNTDALIAEIDVISARVRDDQTVQGSAELSAALATLASFQGEATTTVKQSSDVAVDALRDADAGQEPDPTCWYWLFCGFVFTMLVVGLAVWSTRRSKDD